MRPVRLLADIGGTNARFAWQRSGRKPAGVKVVRVADYSTFEAAVTSYLANTDRSGPVTQAAFAVAGPVVGDTIHFTNNPWTFSIQEIQRNLRWDTLRVINDFAALALAVPNLRADERIKIGRGRPVSNAPVGVIGPGTGLGMAGLMFTERGPEALASEGGKVALAATNDLEAEVIHTLRHSIGYVSAEDVLSGPGLVRLYRALAKVMGHPHRATTAAAITRAGLNGRTPLATKTLEMFMGMLGTVAGDLAMTLCARGGVYLGGGIVPRLGEALRRSAFRHRFEQRGDFTFYLANIPTYAITARMPAFRGLSALLDRVEAEGAGSG
jgi:glucokinase